MTCNECRQVYTAELNQKKINQIHDTPRSDSVIKLVSDLITELDQAVWAVHSCNSWLTSLAGSKY